METKRPFEGLFKSPETTRKEAAQAERMRIVGNFLPSISGLMHRVYLINREGIQLFDASGKPKNKEEEIHDLKTELRDLCGKLEIYVDDELDVYPGEIVNYDRHYQDGSRFFLPTQEPKGKIEVVSLPIMDTTGIVIQKGSFRASE